MMAAGSLLSFSLTPSLYPKLKAKIRAVPALRIQKHAVLDGDAANSSIMCRGGLLRYLQTNASEAEVQMLRQLEEFLSWD
jgi:hypothetical protein